MTEIENEEQSAKENDPLESIVPSAEDNIVIIGKDDYELTFTQKPLSFFGKLDFFSVLGKTIDKAMSGPDGVSIADLLEVPSRDGGLTANDFKDADLFVRGISKIASYAPEMAEDLYCVILAVPRGQRVMAKTIMSFSEEDGGLSDEQGIKILETFVDQNWEVMVDFFKGRMSGLVDKVNQKMAPPSPSSKRSKATRQTTQKVSKS